MRRLLPALLALAFACGGGGPSPRAAAPPEPGPDPAPRPGTSLALERLDGAAECDGLLPERVPAPVALARTPPDGATCAGGTSDGTGHLAVAALAGDGAASWQVFAPDGAPAASFSAWPLVPAPSGWHGLAVTAPASPDDGPAVVHLARAPDGGPARATPLSRDPAQLLAARWSLAADPSGGSVALLADVDRLHNHWSAVWAQRFDAAGAARWADPVRLAARSEQVFFLVAGVSRGGEALALWQHSAYLDVGWIDAAGGAAASAELAERAAEVLATDALAPALELVPLLDGALAVRAGGALRRIYPRLATRGAPLPAWLAARADWTWRFTRGDRGYAALPPAGQDAPGCTQAIELRAPSGRLCGRIVLQPERPGACVTGAVDQGLDGTVVQQAAQGACAWRAWPALLR